LVDRQQSRQSASIPTFVAHARPAHPTKGICSSQSHPAEGNKMSRPSAVHLWPLTLAAFVFVLVHLHTGQYSPRVSFSFDQRACYIFDDSTAEHPPECCMACLSRQPVQQIQFHGQAKRNVLKKLSHRPLARPHLMTTPKACFKASHAHRHERATKIEIVIKRAQQQVDSFLVRRSIASHMGRAGAKKLKTCFLGRNEI
jgi:hypothetical protein